MSNIFKAIFENGVLRPLSKLDLTEHEEVEFIILDKGDDLPAMAIAKLAETGKSFDFLADPEEDVYTLEDGEPV